MLKTECLFYFIFLHTCITPRQATPGVGLLFGFILLHLMEWGGGREEVTQTNPVLEAVSGQAVGSGFPPEEESVGVEEPPPSQE